MSQLASASISRTLSYDVVEILFCAAIDHAYPSQCYAQWTCRDEKAKNPYAKKDYLDVRQPHVRPYFTIPNPKNA